MFQQSIALFEAAQQHIPGGVNSPVRAFKSVGGNPIFAKRASGTYVFDEDDKAYIDCIASWGPMILGHAHPAITAAIQGQVENGTSYGMPTALEIAMAKLIKSMVPNIDLIRMVNSGTEACMSAIRLARGYTKRNKIIKFNGCYHGHADSFLVKAGSGLATLDIEQVPGVSVGVANDTLVAPYNNLAAVEALVSKYPNEIAAIIVEPVAGNMGCILPKDGFLEGLRTICDDNQIVLIFDEVMTGFRLAAGGAQALLQVEADLVTYGKIIGAGLPVGAFGGKRCIMEHLAPLGKVYQAGTLSGNPLAMTAGYTLLSLLQAQPDVYNTLANTTERLAIALRQIFTRKGIPVTINHIGSMISVHFCEHEVVDFESAAACNQTLFSQYFHHMLREGVYLPPSAFESWFLNSCLGDKEVTYIVDATASFTVR
jgi:glutamate-1-semialdehyde 2,1-aminomutase